MPEIKDALRDSNPWWKGPFKITFKDRDIYAQIQKYLELPQIIALTGLRRVGKTTLMLKIIEDSITAGADAGNILYFSLDEFKDIELRKLLHEYEDLLEKDLTRGRYLLVLDEIQKLDNWENQLKGIYDTFRKRVKIIVSGSESLFIRKKATETLAGRIFNFKIDPLSFREFISFKGITVKPLGLYERELAALLDEYILTLGFPELISIRDKEVIKKYVQESIVEKVVFRDMQYLFRIKDVSVIESLLKIFLEEPGQLVDISSLSREFGVSRQTLSTYLTYLEESFLIRKLYNYSKSRRKVERKLKKYYPTILSPDLLFKEDELSKSKVFEWLIVVQLKAEFFWRDPYKNEVDIVLSGKRVIPIEIKYGKIDTKGMLVFMKKFNISEGIIVTRNKEEKYAFDHKEIVCKPGFKFLLKKEEYIEL